MTFSIIYKGEHGETVTVDSPKMEAYAYQVRAHRQGRGTSTIWHEDGAVTVKADGLMTLTFVAE